MSTSLQKPSFFGILTEFRKWIILILVALVLFFGYKYFSSKGDTSVVEYDTALIQQQIKNVGKLVVTEGHFAEVITYKDSKKYMGDLISFEKKAIVVINADVTVSFDLSKMKYDIDSINKVITVVEIPKEEIKIAPDFKYYNTESSTFNEFTGEDYNKINKIARANLAMKIQASTLKTNAKNRLLSELNSLFIVTKNLGWTMKYKDEVITSDKEVKQKFLN
ncbi:DUF4230 domain-containing protein [Flavobacterium sp. F372]|uniref:DUF4230 domain-containing protein n=1 Tax=Flavobacterium bernardetii TaxID=2813823 RepID=A0ABR7IXP6_9FLAO|nr:DUF4230 domain-containing protein [Flavobacterium bernardetii]MBC5834541.1 DUF4230 domain-containing protein [Flavobacterium bernardetii]NHF70189.1 DUF4230 domain-containing protein [Flavobacterium bernardetii]